MQQNFVHATISLKFSLISEVYNKNVLAFHRLD